MTLQLGVALELRTLHCDAGRPDESATFALNILLDQWCRLVWQHDVTKDFRENVRDAKRVAWGAEWDAQLERLHQNFKTTQVGRLRSEYSHADLFVADTTPIDVFAPVAHWLRGRNNHSIKRTAA